MSQRGGQRMQRIDLNKNRWWIFLDGISALHHKSLLYKANKFQARKINLIKNLIS